MVHRRKKWQRKGVFGTPMRVVACPKLMDAMSPVKRNAHEALERYMKQRPHLVQVGPGDYPQYRAWRADWLRQCLIYGPKWHMDALRHRAREEIAGADAYSVVS